MTPLQNDPQQHRRRTNENIAFRACPIRARIRNLREKRCRVPGKAIESLGKNEKNVKIAKIENNKETQQQHARHTASHPAGEVPAWRERERERTSLD
jgi:hypothetical protein